MPAPVRVTTSSINIFLPPRCPTRCPLRLPPSLLHNTHIPSYASRQSHNTRNLTRKHLDCLLPAVCCLLPANPTITVPTPHNAFLRWLQIPPLPGSSSQPTIAGHTQAALSIDLAPRSMVTTTMFPLDSTQQACSASSSFPSQPASSRGSNDHTPSQCDRFSASCTSRHAQPCALTTLPKPRHSGLEHRRNDMPEKRGQCGWNTMRWHSSTGRIQPTCPEENSK